MTGKEVLEIFKRSLDAGHIRYDVDEERLLIKMVVHGDDLPQPTFVHVHDDRQVVQLISPLTTKMPEDKRMECAVAVCVANFGLVNGSFDMDMSDGEIRYRVCQSFHDADLTEETARYLLGVIFNTTDRYNDRFFMLGKGMMSLEQFIKMDEG